ncbi:MAG: S8 family serine peptidase [Acidobacteriia bacterium]|nr:S8 family serine peptidase [Terriglobia bacterium]
MLGFVSSALAAGSLNRYAKLDDELNRRATTGASSQTTTVILRVKGSDLPAGLKKYARPGNLGFINAFVLDVPNGKLKAVNEDPGTEFASSERTAVATNFRTSIQNGAFFARRMLGFTGAGVGVAVIDSGITVNEEFAAWQGVGRRPGRSRIAYFRDFLVPDKNHLDSEIACAAPCDPNGHGTHVAGTIAGNGFYSFGEQSGMAPDASLISLRVLGKDGSGSLTGVLNALQWVLQNAKRYNIRVVNLSLGIAPTGTIGNGDPKSVGELLNEDPLALATKKLVDAGILVVGAAGNVGQVDCQPVETLLNGKNTQCDAWGGITAPGSYPWVFTAGADSSAGTYSRQDDKRAAFSSRGPAFPLQNAKPDILAGGVGIESTSAPGSTLYKQADVLHFLLPGSFPTAGLPYLALTGTSQASAVMSGVAAVMLQANPRLTPNLIRAIVEYTSQDYTGYSPLEQGAGFLNALGAVRLARFYETARIGQHVPVEPIWSQHFIWGNHELSGGLMLPTANAWNVGVEWGAVKTDDGENIVWGTSCGAVDCGENIVWGTSDDENIVWGTADEGNIVWGTQDDPSGNIVWGTDFGDENIVWGTDCGGGDCENIVWGTKSEDGNIVWGTAEGDENIVWGTDAAGNIVWGTDAQGNIVWGTDDDGENIVWGTDDFDENIVWGTDDSGDENIVWGTDTENIVWGTDDENIVWGTDDENIVWGTARPTTKPASQEEWYRMFLNRNFDVLWVSREFGDTFKTRDGRGIAVGHWTHGYRKAPVRGHHK